VNDIFSEYPDIEWITSLYKSSVSEAGSFQSLYKVLGYSARAFQTGLHGSRQNPHFIQQETCFWRRSLWETIGGKIPSDYLYAADFHLWSKFFNHAQLAGVAAPLAMFRNHTSQRSAASKYMDEVDSILKHHCLTLKGDNASNIWNLHPNNNRNITPMNFNKRWWVDKLSDEIIFDEVSIEEGGKKQMVNCLEKQKQYILELEKACIDRLSLINNQDQNRQILEERILTLEASNKKLMMMLNDSIPQIIYRKMRGK
jgi:hypothetical protein